MAPAKASTGRIKESQKNPMSLQNNKISKHQRLPGSSKQTAQTGGADNPMNTTPPTSSLRTQPFCDVETVENKPKFRSTAAIRMEALLMALSSEDTKLIKEHTKAIHQARISGDKTAYHVVIPGEGKTLLPYSSAMRKDEAAERTQACKGLTDSWKEEDDLFYFKELPQEDGVSWKVGGQWKPL